MLNVITWDVNPEIFHIGIVHIRWYGLLWALAILSALWVVTSIYRHEGRPEVWSDKLFVYGAVSLIVGARLGHCFFYGAPDDFWFYYKHPFELLKIWEGGLASHGGAVGLLIGMWLYNKYTVKKSYLYVMDRLVVGVAIGGALIRLGNLMNSEIFGEVTTLPWGFNFINSPQWQQIGLPVHPTQIYEIIYCLITFAVCMLMYWKWKSYRREGLIFGVFLIGIFLTRFLLEYIKLNQEKFEETMPVNMGQLLSLPLIIWGIYLIINALRKPAELQDFEKEGYKKSIKKANN
ncbi:MAG: prolipoprotein diacylglyceryl transferase [Prevotellaceae bacterium]|jgi:prolipoprotein diacylglyceryl transferase|nr:prolipoprotein diacylglyceryl transferase [Prevotellaceae bacterium]